MKKLWAKIISVKESENISGCDADFTTPHDERIMELPTQLQLDWLMAELPRQFGMDNDVSLWFAVELWREDEDGKSGIIANYSAEDWVPELDDDPTSISFMPMTWEKAKTAHFIDTKESYEERMAMMREMMKDNFNSCEE